MFTTQATVHSMEEARILAILSVIVLITFWRVIVRVALVALAALMAALVGLGIFALVGFMHY